jgi:Holliday junction resolvase
MGKASRDKGGRFERELVNTAKAHGLEAYRVPLSGAAAGFKNDIIIKQGRTTWEIEAKKRATGFKFIYDNIAGADILVIGADRQKPLAVLDYEDFCDLLNGALK